MSTSRFLQALFIGAALSMGTGSLAGDAPFIGDIAWFASNFAPSGWHLCDGAAISRTGNSVLFGLIGTTYGVGDGSTTFNLPDLQGRSPMHTHPGTSGGALGNTGGAETVTLALNQLPIHNHSFIAAPDNANQTLPTLHTLGVTAFDIYKSDDQCSLDLVAMVDSSIGQEGLGQAHDNMSPFLTLTCIIALEGTTPPVGSATRNLPTDLCTGGGAFDCDDHNPCTTDNCDTETGQCSHMNVMDGVACNAGDACVSNATCQSGTCTCGTNVNCADNNQCTNDSCDSQTGCLHINRTGPCGADDVCNNNGMCVECILASDCPGATLCNIATCTNLNECTYAPKDCDDLIPCTLDSCDNGTGNCLHTPRNNLCSGGDQCNAPICDVQTGCTTQALSGNSCNDGNKCSADDICTNGTCAGTTVVCVPPDTCSTASCNSETGQCDVMGCSTPTFCNDVTPVGTCVQCDVAFPCPGDLTCDAGVCTGCTSADDCVAGDKCTIASCEDQECHYRPKLSDDCVPDEDDNSFADFIPVPAGPVPFIPPPVMVTPENNPRAPSNSDEADRGIVGLGDASNDGPINASIIVATNPPAAKKLSGAEEQDNKDSSGILSCSQNPETTIRDLWLWLTVMLVFAMRYRVRNRA